MSFALNRRAFLKSASGVLLGLAHLPGYARAASSGAGTVASSASWGDGNFGVNTSLTFKTFPVAEVTVFRLVWSSGLDELLPAALDLLPTTPDQLGCKLSVEAGKDEQLELIGQLVATEGELTSLLAPLYRVATPNQLAVRALPYWDSQEFLSEEGPPEYSHERSRYIFRPLPPEGARTILDFLRRWPGTGMARDRPPGAFAGRRQPASPPPDRLDARAGDHQSSRASRTCSRR